MGSRFSYHLLPEDVEEEIVTISGVDFDLESYLKDVPDRAKSVTISISVDHEVVTTLHDVYPESVTISIEQEI